MDFGKLFKNIAKKLGVKLNLRGIKMSDDSKPLM